MVGIQFPQTTHGVRPEQARVIVSRYQDVDVNVATDHELDVLAGLCFVAPQDTVVLGVQDKIAAVRKTRLIAKKAERPFANEETAVTYEFNFAVTVKGSTFRKLHALKAEQLFEVMEHTLLAEVANTEGVVDVVSLAEPKMRGTRQVI